MSDRPVLPPSGSDQPSSIRGLASAMPSAIGPALLALLGCGLAFDVAMFVLQFLASGAVGFPDYGRILHYAERTRAVQDLAYLVTIIGVLLPTAALMLQSARKRAVGATATGAALGKPPDVSIETGSASPLPSTSPVPSHVLPGARGQRAAQIEGWLREDPELGEALKEIVGAATSGPGTPSIEERVAALERYAAQRSHAEPQWHHWLAVGANAVTILGGLPLIVGILIGIVFTALALVHH